MDFGKPVVLSPVNAHFPLVPKQDMKRHGPLHAFPDARVDVALFFIPPHRLRPNDVDFITELSELVPVVRGGSTPAARRPSQ